MPSQTKTITSTMESARKRPRLAPEAYGKIFAKCADEETSLEVDHMILDYLFWKALNISSRSSRAEAANGPDQSVMTAGDFLALFKQRYPGFKFDLEMQFRILLLKTATLMSHRFARCPCSPALENVRSMRDKNEDRAARWIGNSERRPTHQYDTSSYERDLPVSQEYLRQTRAHVLRSLELPVEDDSSSKDVYYGTSECVSLLDVLPLFLRVCAVCRTFHGGNMTESLMDLTRDLMLKACLEQYLVFGAHGTDAIDEAFAWGYQSDEQLSSGLSELRDDERQLNLLFEDEENASEVVEWAHVRDETVALLMQPKASEIDASHRHGVLLQHLEQLDDQLSLEHIESRLRGFLQGLALSVDEPVLAQLEKGQMKGMSEAETQQFLRNCGPDVIKLFRC